MVFHNLFGQNSLPTKYKKAAAVISEQNPTVCKNFVSKTVDRVCSFEDIFIESFANLAENTYLGPKT